MVYMHFKKWSWIQPMPRFRHKLFTPFTSLTLGDHLSISSLASSHSPESSIYGFNQTLTRLIEDGHLQSAENLFDNSPHRDAVSYNLLIAGNAKHGTPSKALHFYGQLISSNLIETPSTFSSVLSICTRASLHVEGAQAHCRVIKLGVRTNPFIVTALVGLYMRLGCFQSGLRLFFEYPRSDLATWNAAYRGLSEGNRCFEIISLFEKMRGDGIKGDGLSFSYLIRCCCDPAFLKEGIQLHSVVVKLGWDKSNVFVANGLVEFYCKCKMLPEARASFFEVPQSEFLSWDALLSLHIESRFGDSETLILFSTMRNLGAKPSISSCIGILKFLREVNYLLFGRQVQCLVTKIGYDSCVHLQSALIDMYGKCGEIEASVSLFDSLPCETLECCNSFMTSLMHCGRLDEVIEMGKKVITKGIKPDEVTLSTFLKAISNSSFSSLETSKMLHSFSLKLGFLSHITIPSSLIDSYSRSGSLIAAERVFDEVESPNVVCFTAMISANARYGRGEECLKLFKRMIESSLEPDSVTFLCVLSGLSHSGMVEEGRSVFDFMRGLGVTWRREHVACMVDLLGRSGLIGEAEALVEKGDYVMWSSLLRSCKAHKNERIGRIAAEALLNLDPDDFSVYMQIANFYFQIGEFDTSRLVREIAISRKITRGIGLSLIEIA